LKAIVLAAGFATRLFPLTVQKPKPLLKVGGRPMVEYTIRLLEAAADIDAIYIITNKLYYNDFLVWAQNYKSNKLIKVLSNHVFHPTEKFTAMQNAQFVVDSEGITDACIVCAGDHMFDFDLNDMVAQLKKTQSSQMLVYEPENEEKSYAGGKRYAGSVVIDGSNVVKKFVEKPANPESNLIGICFYILVPGDVQKIRQFLLTETELAQKDPPGYFIQWLHSKTKMYGYKIGGDWFDVGDGTIFLNANLHYLQDGLTKEDNVVFASSTQAGRNFVSQNSQIVNSRLENCFVFENVQLVDCKLKNCVIGPDSKITGVHAQHSVLGPKTILNGLSPA
jgi:glucose-1-phosphate thymidylyltransferase